MAATNRHPLGTFLWKARWPIPITFEQPSQVSPQISTPYGAALQFSQDVPTIANLAIHTADLQHSTSLAADQMRQQNAALGAQSANENMNRIAQSQNANANREQGALDLGAQLDAHANANMLQANTGLIAQQRGAELGVWANQQEMTQGENMRLQRLQQGLDAVMADPNLGAPGEMTPDRANIVTQLRSGIDPLKQKQEVENTKQAAMKTQLLQGELANMAEVTKTRARVNKMTEEERKGVDLTPDAQAELEGRTDLNPQQIADERRNMIAKGRYRSYTIDDKGNLVYDKPGSGGSGGGGVDKSYEADQKHYETDLKNVMAEEKHYHDAKQDIRDRVIRENRDQHKEDPNGVRIAGADEVDAEVERQMAKSSIPKPRARPTPPPRPGQTPPPGAAPATATGGTPTSDSPVSQPKTATAVLDDTLQTVNQRPMPPQTKMQLNAVIEQSKAMLAKAKGYNNLSETEKRQYDSNREFVRRTLIELPPPPPPQQGPPIDLNQFIPQGMIGDAARRYQR